MQPFTPMHSLYILVFLFFHISASAVPTNPCPSKFTDYDDSGGCYLKNANAKFADAEQACTTSKAHLSSVHNAFENGHLMTLSGQKSVWLGGKYDGSRIIWNDGSANNYAKWKSGEPKGSGCIVLDSSGTWIIDDCSKSYPAICKRPAVQDCLEWMNSDNSGSSLYPAFFGGQEMQIYCDMESDGGGWTMMQNRYDGSEPFWNRTWADYKSGFGQASLTSNYWLGNEAMHLLTNQGVDNELLVQLWGDRQPGSNVSDAFWWARYYNFSIDGEAQNYVFYAWMSWPDFPGNASANWYDITYSSGRPFSTVDKINDPDVKCVKDYHLGGWWLYHCAFCSLNGEYVPPIGWGNGYGMFWMIQDPNWHAGEPYQYIINPKRSRMLFRRKAKSSAKEILLKTNRIDE